EGHAGGVGADDVAGDAVAAGALQEDIGVAGIAGDEVAGAGDADEVAGRIDEHAGLACQAARRGVGDRGRAVVVRADVVALDDVAGGGAAGDVYAIAHVAADEVAGAAHSAADDVAARAVLDLHAGTGIGDGGCPGRIGTDVVAFDEDSGGRSRGTESADEDAG